MLGVGLVVGELEIVIDRVDVVVAVGLGELVGVTLDDEENDALSEFVRVGDLVGVFVTVFVAELGGVFVGVGRLLDVGVLDGVVEAELVGVFVLVSVLVDVGVLDGVAELLDVGVFDGVVEAELVGVFVLVPVLVGEVLGVRVLDGVVEADEVWVSEVDFVCELELLLVGELVLVLDAVCDVEPDLVPEGLELAELETEGDNDGAWELDVGLGDEEVVEGVALMEIKVALLEGDALFV